LSDMNNVWRGASMWPKEASAYLARLADNGAPSSWPVEQWPPRLTWRLESVRTERQKSLELAKSLQQKLQDHEKNAGS